MKFNKLFMGFLGLGAVALTACSSEENAPQLPDTTDSEARFMSVSIRNSGLQTRGEGDQAGETYEEGLSKENDVQSIRFYFFKEDGSAFPVAPGNLNFYDCKKTTGDDNQIVVDGTNMPNDEKIFKAILVLNPQEVDFSQLKSMVAVVNFEKAITDNSAKNLSTLQTTVDDYGIYKNYNNKSTDIPLMLMTSSVYGPDPQDANSKYEGCEVYINPLKLKTTKIEAQNDPVEIYVERVLAKVRMTTNWANSMTTLKIGDNGPVLVQLKDKSGNAYKTADGKDIYAKFIGWGMQTYTDQSYLFKNIGGKNSLATWNQNLGAWWNDDANHRSYWALNPASAKCKHRTHTSANGKIGSKVTTTVEGVTTTIQYDGDFFYTQENAADAASGLKVNADYDPDNGLSTRTQAYIQAVLVDNTGNPVSYAEWGNVKYTESGVKTAMLNSVNNQIWLKKKTVTSDGSTTTTQTDWITIPEDFIALVPAEDAGKANTSTENSKRYLSYIQLKNDYEKLFETGGAYAEYDGKFYYANKTEITADAGENGKSMKDKVNEILAGMPGAKVWRDGNTYFYTDLQHLNPSTETVDNTTKGAFGVVRNHIYEVQLNTIYGLGTPVLIPNQDGDTEKEIIPQKPTPDAYFLGARLHILSWRVVANDTSLDW